MPIEEIDLNRLDEESPAPSRTTRYGRRASHYRPVSPAPSALPGDTPDDIGFFDSLRQQSPTTRELPEPSVVLADPERIKRARTLAATLEIPFASAYQAEPQLSVEMEKRDPGWLKKAGTSFMRGWGNMYVTGGRALELAGATDFAQTYVGFGRYLQQAYLPTEQPKEFSWRRIADPDWYATTIAESIPSALSLVPAAIIGAYGAAAGGAALGFGALGKTVLGALGGAALSRPIEAGFEAGGQYEDALARGARPEEAEKQAASVFKGNLSLAGMDAAQFALAFTPLGRIPGAKTVAARVAAATGRYAGVAAIEGVEEGFQTALQQWARGERLSFDSEMSESVAAGMVFGLGLAGTGSVFNALTGRIENTMPAKLTEQFETEKQTALAQGMSEQSAELRALDRIAETDEGRAHVEKVVKDLKTIVEGGTIKAPTTEEIDSEINQIGEREGAVEGELFTLSYQEFDAMARGELSIEDLFASEPSTAEISLSEAKGEVISEYAEIPTASSGVGLRQPSGASISKPPSQVTRQIPSGPSDTGLSISPFFSFSIDPTSKRRIYQPSEDINRNLDTATRLQPSLDAALKDVAGLVEGSSFNSSRIKKLSHIEEKTRRKGGTGANINDYLGARLSVGNIADTAKVVDELSRKGFEVVETDNFSQVPRADGYRATHLQLRESGGSSFEVQVSVKEIAEAQEAGHDIYEEMRQLAASPQPSDEQRARLAELLAQSRELYDTAWKKYQGRTGAEGERETSIVSEAAYEAALKRLKEKIGGFHAGIDPTALADMVVVGTYHIERGARTFAEWSKFMLERFGESIKKHLDDIWAQSSNAVSRGIKSGMAEPVAAAEAAEGATQPAGQVKGQVRRSTGIERVAKMVREDEALRASFKKAEQSARIAYRVGTTDALERARGEFNERLTEAQRKAERFGFGEGFKLAEKMTRKELIAAFKDSAKSAQDTRQALFELIQENLPPDMRGKFLQSIVGEVSKRRQESILRRIEQTKDMLDKNQLVEDLEGMTSFKGTVAIDYSRKIQELVKDIDLKKMSAGTRQKMADLKLYADMHGMPSGIRAETLRQLERLEKRPVGELTADDLRPLVEQVKHLQAMGKLKLELKNKYDERQRKMALSRLIASTENADPKIRGGLTALKTYVETLQAPRAGEIFDGYKAGENTKLVKRLQNAETDAKWDIRTTMDGALEEITALGIKQLDDAANLRVMLHLRAEEGATDQVATLLAHYGLQEVPPLEKGEAELIKILREYSNADTGRLSALYEEITNTPFPVLESRVLPLKYEGEPRISAEEAIIQMFRKRTQTEQGFTVQRQAGVKRLPRIDVLNVFEEGINETKWYLGMQPVLDDIARLVKTREYVGAAGEVASNWWKDHLDIVARRGISADAARLPFDNALRAARGNLQTAILGWKLSSIMMQPFAVIDAMAYAQGRWGPSAALKVAGEFAQSWIVPGHAKEYIASSEKLKLRATGELAVQESLEKAGRSESLKAKFIRGGMSLLQKADVRTAAGAQQAFEKILIGEGMAQAEARREAGLLMELTASSADLTFRPHILARGEVWKTVFTFQSFVMNRWGLVAHDLIGKGVIKGDYKAKLAAMVGLAVIVAGTIAEDEARRYVYEVTRGTKAPDRPAWQDALYGIPELVPLFGGLFSQINTGRTRVPPVARAIEDLVGPVIAPDNPRKWIRAVRSGIAIGTGIPGTAQAADLIERILIPPEKPGKIKRTRVGD